MLSGPRVTLRAVTPEDHPRLTRFRNDAELQLLLGDIPLPVTEAAVAELFDARARDTAGVGFAIEVDGAVIGDVGLRAIDRLYGTAEFGIAIGDRTCWGRGYGREATGLLVDYGFRMQNLRRIWLRTHATNERALRSYRAVGFVEEGRQREHAWVGGRYVDLVLMGLLRSQWSSPFAAPAGG